MGREEQSGRVFYMENVEVFKRNMMLLFALLATKNVRLEYKKMFLHGAVVEIDKTGHGLRVQLNVQHYVRNDILVLKD